jgi:hypothetical protein
MNIRLFVPAFLGLFGFELSLGAFTQPEQAQGFSVGYDVGSVANGLALGVRASSPSFFNNIFRATAKAHLGWVQNAVPINEDKAYWLPYGLFRLGLQGGVFIPNLPIRISSFGEVALVTPHNKISSNKVNFGLAGGTDIEFFMDPNFAHAIVLTMGGIGMFSTTAENLKNQPSYANGFFASFGYRFYL